LLGKGYLKQVFMATKYTRNNRRTLVGGVFSWVRHKDIPRSSFCSQASIYVLKDIEILADMVKPDIENIRGLNLVVTIV
jgi:hypothetical protein